MTDFYSVLQRAVSSLPDSSGPNRRAVYDKARKALLKQLQSFDPPLPSSDVTAQRLALEDAIRKIENEIARQIRTQRALQSAVPTGGGARPRTAAPLTPAQNAEAAADRAEEEERIARRAAEAERARKQNAELLAAAVSQATVLPATAAEPEPAPVVRGPPVPVPAPQRQSGLPDPEDVAERTDEVMFEEDVDFRAPERRERAHQADIVDGEYDEVDPDEDALGPAVDPREEKAARREALRARKEEERRLKADRRSERKKSRADARARAPVADRGERPPRKRSGLLAKAVLPLVILALLIGASYAAYTQRATLFAILDEVQEDPADRPAISVDGRTVTKSDDRLPSTLEGEDTRTVTTTTWPPQEDSSAAPVIEAEPAGDPAAAPEEVTRLAPDAQTTPAEDEVRAVGTDAAPIPETAAPENVAPETSVPGDTAAAAPAADAPAPDTPVAEVEASGTQNAVLYEEAAQAGEPQSAVAGGVEWSMVRQSIGGGEPEPVVRAQANIPERGMTLTMTVRKNLDGALPASHLIELEFNIPDTYEGGGVKNVPGVIMKQNEQARGEALRGAAARVSSGLFWIALSETPDDRVANLELLRSRDWIDIPILYESGRRAILTLRKGGDGFDAVTAAINAWNPGSVAEAR